LSKLSKNRKKNKTSYENIYEKKGYNENYKSKKHMRHDNDNYIINRLSSNKRKLLILKMSKR